MASLEMPAQEVGTRRRQKGADLESRTGRSSLEVGYETQMAWEDRENCSYSTIKLKPSNLRPPGSQNPHR